MNALIDWINTWAVWAGIGLLGYLGVAFLIELLIARSFRDRDQQTPEQERTTRNEV